MGERELQYFSYGMCTMFYGIMAWLFYRKSDERLKKLVTLIMVVLLAQCLKDLNFIGDFYSGNQYISMLMTSIDVLVVPIYGFILTELCRPGRLTKRAMVLHELPFVALLLLFAISGNEIFYYIQVVAAATYGFSFACWVLIEVPRYHHVLKEYFSYDKNINLHWLRAVMISFFVILMLWFASSIFLDIDSTTAYLISVPAIWTVACFFIYKHESVIDELQTSKDSALPTAEEPPLSPLGEKIHRLFVTEKMYLNPRLKLSDLARKIGTNRTYLSHYFNKEKNTTFFDYVNDLRIDHAIRLIKETDLTIENIAEQSGFCSKSTFYRAYKKKYNSTPPHCVSQFPDIQLI